MESDIDKGLILFPREMESAFAEAIDCQAGLAIKRK